MDVLKKINDMRIERGWSEYRLAVQAGIAQSTISEWYSKDTLPTLSTLEKICDAFGVSLSQFFMDTSEHQAILTEQEKILLSYMSRLDPPLYEAVSTLIRTMCEQGGQAPLKP